ncbi:MAG: hypothetical protein K0R34_1875 [Herbinix sp.]|jgi:flagellar hook-length control protein FliK|nr:hypothetical protein [Herbinix sp.]
MMTQGVMTQAANLFGNATGSVTLKGKQNSSSFDLMMDSTMKLGPGTVGSSENPEVKNVSNQSTVKDSQDKSDVVNGSREQAGDATKGTTNTENTKAATEAGNQTKKTEDTKQTEDVKDGNSEESEIDEETLEKIAGLLQAVQQTVMDLLKLTSAELDKLLSEQGLELADLLQPENLQQLVLADSKASNILAILTDENLSDTMNQLLKSVEDLMADSGLGLSPEQIEDILDQAKLLQASSQVTSEEEITGEKVITKQESNEEVAMNVRDTKGEDNISSSKSAEDKNIQVEVVKVTDTNGSSETQSDLNKNNNQELQATEQFEAFLNNLSKASTSNQVSFNGNMVQVTEIREIANQIIERIKITIKPEQSSMELQLNPENLGKVNLSVQSKNGVMTAQFVVQNEISREAIESQLQTLRDTLNQQGIKVEAIEVTVATYSFEQNNKETADGQADNKQGHNSNKISLEEAISMSDDMEDNVSSDITGIRGSQIDYSA